MKTLLTLGYSSLLAGAILFGVIACKPNPAVPAKESAPVAETLTAANLNDMWTRCHSLNVTWRVACTEGNPNGIVVIETVNSEIVKRKCTLDDYLTNYYGCYDFGNMKKKDFINQLTIAQAAVIVAYEKKLYDISEYLVEVETRAMSFSGRKQGIPLKCKIDSVGWK